MTLLLVLTAFITILMGSFIVTILFLYRKKQISYFEKLNQIQTDYEKNLLKTQLEIQEQTFEHISREIHDNINLSLTLAKLNLNTIEFKNDSQQAKIESTVSLLSKSIQELSDISKGLNADLIIQQGLVKAIDEELIRIKQIGTFNVGFIVDGNPIFLNAQKELIIFRIIQEAFNNIIKHANTKVISLNLHYSETELMINIKDNGQGFDIEHSDLKNHAGLKNMQTRAKILGGSMHLKSEIGKGTSLIFKIPYYNNEN